VGDGSGSIVGGVVGVALGGGLGDGGDVPVGEGNGTAVGLRQAVAGAGEGRTSAFETGVPSGPRSSSCSTAIW
jgi:hypothetical protein